MENKNLVMQITITIPDTEATAADVFQLVSKEVKRHYKNAILKAAILKHGDNPEQNKSTNVKASN